MDAILILGAAVWAAGPSPTLARRTQHAATLWHANAAPLIVPCGGLGKHPPTEAAMMGSLLIANDVDPAAILLEDRSTTTFENIQYAKALVPGKEVIIVTDGYHGARALMVARHLGVTAQLSAPVMGYIPWKQYLREAIARPAYALKLQIRHRPSGH